MTKSELMALIANGTTTAREAFTDEYWSAKSHIGAVPSNGGNIYSYYGIQSKVISTGSLEPTEISMKNG